MKALLIVLGCFASPALSDFVTSVATFTIPTEASISLIGLPYPNVFEGPDFTRTEYVVYGKEVHTAGTEVIAQSFTGTLIPAPSAIGYVVQEGLSQTNLTCTLARANGTSATNTTNSSSANASNSNASPSGPELIWNCTGVQTFPGVTPGGIAVTKSIPTSIALKTIAADTYVNSPPSSGVYYDDSLSGGDIAAITLGTLVLVGGLLAGTIWLIRRRRRRLQAQKDRLPYTHQDILTKEKNLSLASSSGMLSPTVPPKDLDFIPYKYPKSPNADPFRSPTTAYGGSTIVNGDFDHQRSDTRSDYRRSFGGASAASIPFETVSRIETAIGGEENTGMERMISELRAVREEVAELRALQSGTSSPLTPLATRHQSTRSTTTIGTAPPHYTQAKELY